MMGKLEFTYPYYNDLWVWIALAVCALVGIIVIEICERGR